MEQLTNSNIAFESFVDQLDDPFLATVLPTHPSRIFTAIREYSSPTDVLLGSVSIDDLCNTMEQLARDNRAQLDARAGLELGDTQLRNSVFRKHRQSMLDLQLQRVRSLRAPIRKLSHDVLVEIFSHLPPTRICVFTPLLAFPVPSDDDPSASPVASCSYVCLYWNQVILSSPALWQTFSLGTYPEGSVSSSEIYAVPMADRIISPHLVRQHLEYSSNLPLHIRVVVPEMTPGCGGIFADVWRSIVTQKDRWESLHLEGDISDLLRIFPSNDPLHLPLLKHLGLPSGVKYWTGEPLMVFEFAPSLRSLTATGFSADDIQLPWAQIEALTIKEFLFNGYLTNTHWNTPRTVYDFLTEASNLRCLSITCAEDQVTFGVYILDTILLKHLTRLKISGDISLGILRILSGGCSSLTLLDIQLGGWDDDESLHSDDLLPFFAALPNIQILALSIVEGEEWGSLLLVIFELIPFLTSLTLNNTIPDEIDFYAEMMAQPDSPDSTSLLLPFLKTWALLPRRADEGEIPDTVLTAILDVCSSRRQLESGKSSLHTLQLRVNEKNTAEMVLNEARQLMENGLELDIIFDEM